MPDYIYPDYIYCIRQKEIDFTQITKDTLLQYFSLNSIKIDYQEREYIYTNTGTVFYTNKNIAKEVFLQTYNRFKESYNYIILPIKGYLVNAFDCILIEEINKNYTNTKFNFKVWRR